MICFYYRIYGLFIRELIFSYAAQRALKILRKVFPFCAGCNSIVRITDSFIVNVATNAANILFHRFYRLLCLYFTKSRHKFRDFITYLAAGVMIAAVGTARVAFPMVVVMITPDIWIEVQLTCYQRFCI